jgi:hypothetical protein
MVIKETIAKEVGRLLGATLSMPASVILKGMSRSRKLAERHRKFELKFQEEERSLYPRSHSSNSKKI